MTQPRVIGLLSWWDESATWLAATVASMSRFCDHVVALDGRYATYPDLRLQSGVDQVEAIIESARASGLGVTLHTAPRTFADEMQKRSHLFKLAQVEARSFVDWFFILDGDEVVVEAPPKAGIQHALANEAALGRSVVTSTLFERTDPHCDNWRTEVSMKVQLDWRYETASPRFWLAHNAMRVENYHYNYIGEDADGNAVELWGDDTVVINRAAWGSLNGRVVIENRNRLRAKQRDADRQAYYKDRDEQQLERITPLTETKNEDN
jgi:hypothetical protein